MTRALRTRHRRVLSALAVVLPATVAMALAARPAWPPPAALGIAGLAAETAPSLTVAWQGRAGDAALPVVARVGFAAPPAPDAKDAPEPLLDLDVRSAVGRPELLAYWSATAPQGERLPAGSVLLGPVRFQAPRRFPLPAAARTTAGSLVLYGVAEARVAAALALPAADQIIGRGALR